MSQKACDKLYDLVILGAGPGGMASAIEAKLADIDKFLIVDKANNHNDMIRKFYKPAKRIDKDWQGKKFQFIGNVTFKECSKEEYLKQMDKKIKEFRIDNRFYFDHHVYAVRKICDDIFAVATDHELGAILAKRVIISIGRMGKPNKPVYKFPGAIRPRLDFNLDKVHPGEKVLIVGGGDTAGEYAYGLVDMNIGCDVSLNYRRDKIIRMNPTNKEAVERYIQEGKIHSKLGTDIESVEPVPDDKTTPPRVKVNFKNKTNEIYDRVVYGLGGTSPIDFLKNSGIKLNKKNEPVYNEKTMESNIKGLYVIGDVVTSAGSIALAFNHAHLAISDIKNKL